MRIVASKRPAVRGALAPSLAALTLAGLMLAGAVLAPAGGAWAQSRNTRALLDKIERLESRTIDLERQVYQGRPPPPSAGARSRAEPARATDLELRLMQIEEDNRRLTGQLEESQHANRQLTKRLDQLVVDVDQRLKELERLIGERGRDGTAEAGAQANADVAGTETQPPANTPAGGTAPPLAIPAPAAGAAPPPATPRTAVLPAGTPREQYIYAQSLIRKKSYANAEQAFRAFLDANPDNRLAPNAHYWIGETLYVRQKYEDAARVFLAGYQRYPKSSKASDSLLKLGLTLSRLGQAGEACATFDELLALLPENERRLRPKAELERRNARCQ